MMFQMTFAIITPALIAGAFADRMKFSALCIFMALWLLLVYCPIAHWVWGGGWLGDGSGALDFAGGTVVHINAGIAGLVCALMLGKRKGYGTENMAPHNLAYAVIGASLLWVGWFGFNAGSAVAANGRAGMAMAATQIATAAAALGWTFAEWIGQGQAVGAGHDLRRGGRAGGDHPGLGLRAPRAALIIGLVAGVVCFWSATSAEADARLRRRLDAFGVHGVGGMIGALLTGVFAFGPLSATTDHPEGINIGGLAQFGASASPSPSRSSTAA